MNTNVQKAILAVLWPQFDNIYEFERFSRVFVCVCIAARQCCCRHHQAVTARFCANLKQMLQKSSKSSIFNRHWAIVCADSSF